MATTKKKTPPKKVSTAKTKARAKAIPPTWRFYAVTIGIFSIAVTAFVVMAYLTAGIVAKQQNQARLDRINEIYTSIEIGDDYRASMIDAINGRQPLKRDDGRYELNKEFFRGDTVSNTVADLDAKIKAAGFYFVNEPYPGAADVQYIYKSESGDEIGLRVASKPYNDAWQNAVIMTNKTPVSLDSVDVNAGPALVSLYVSLDDNNE